MSDPQQTPSVRVFDAPGTAPMQGTKVVPTMRVGPLTTLISGVPSQHECHESVDVLIQAGTWATPADPPNVVMCLLNGHDSLSVRLTIAQVMLMAQELIRLAGVTQKLYVESTRNANR